MIKAITFSEGHKPKLRKAEYKTWRITSGQERSGLSAGRAGGGRGKAELTRNREARIRKTGNFDGLTRRYYAAWI
jgi:hypothetical protein